MNSQQSAEYVGYDTSGDRTLALKRFYDFVHRHQIPKFHRGTRLLFRRVDLDRAVGNFAIDDVEMRMLPSAVAEREARRA